MKLEKIIFSKHKTGSKESLNFFKKNSLYTILEKKKLVPRKIYLILQSRINNDYIYISNSVEYSDAFELFKLASIVNSAGKIIQNSQYSEKFIIEGIENIDDYNVFIYENFNLTQYKTNTLYKDVLMKEYQEWFLRMEASIGKINKGFNYCNFFVNKDIKTQIKNFFFLLNIYYKPSHREEKNKPIIKVPHKSEKISKYEKTWNEFAEKGVDIRKIEGFSFWK